MAFLVPAIASASTATLVSTGFSVAKGLYEIQQGRRAKERYDAQARYKELEGRIEAVKAKEQGIKALEATRRALASVNATAFAGGLEPTIGTPNTFAVSQVIKPGTTDFFTARANADFAITSSLAQAEDLRFAGRQARKQGLMSGIGSFAQGFTTLTGVGGPPAQPNYGFTPQTSGIR